MSIVIVTASSNSIQWLILIAAFVTDFNTNYQISSSQFYRRVEAQPAARFRGVEKPCTGVNFTSRVFTIIFCTSLIPIKHSCWSIYTTVTANKIQLIFLVHIIGLRYCYSGRLILIIHFEFVFFSSYNNILLFFPFFRGCLVKWVRGCLA